MTKEQLSRGHELQCDIERHSHTIKSLTESSELANKLTITFSNSNTTFVRSISYSPDNEEILETIVSFLLSKEESKLKELQEEFDNL